MAVKVFISYAHKDEAYMEALIEHLTMLKRNAVISEWHDRKIIPGKNWQNEISKNLENAELILFLVSSTFLSSEYCFDIEFARALEKHEEGSAQLIPVVIRPCDWTSSKLGKFQALPKDAQAISKWPNQDDGWLNVVQGIKNHVEQFTPKVAGTAVIPSTTEKRSREIYILAANIGSELRSFREVTGEKLFRITGKYGLRRWGSDANTLAPREAAMYEKERHQWFDEFTKEYNKRFGSSVKKLIELIQIEVEHTPSFNGYAACLRKFPKSTDDISAIIESLTEVAKLANSYLEK